MLPLILDWTCESVVEELSSHCPGKVGTYQTSAPAQGKQANYYKVFLDWFSSLSMCIISTFRSSFAVIFVVLFSFHFSGQPCGQVSNAQAAACSRILSSSSFLLCATATVPILLFFFSDSLPTLPASSSYNLLSRLRWSLRGEGGDAKKKYLVYKKK